MGTSVEMMSDMKGDRVIIDEWIQMPHKGTGYHYS